MRILVISNLYPPYVLGGYEILCEQIVQGLKSLNHEVGVLTSRHGLGSQEPKKDILIWRILEVYQPFNQKAGVMRMKRFRTAKHNQAQTKQILKEFKPELVFVFSQLRLTLACAKEAQKAGLKIVYSFNDEHIAGYLPAVWKFDLKGIAAALLDRTLFKKLTLAGLNLRNSLCISHLLKKNLLEKKVACSTAKVIHQGIPLEKFPIKQKAGQISEPAKVLYVGQLHKYKGVHTLIKAIHHLSKKRKSSFAQLCVVGEGPLDYQADLQKLADTGPGKVEFKGKIPHEYLSQIYNDHDIFVFSSEWEEPFGLTHLEAMAKGLPVISTANGGQKEFLKHRENALIFKAGSVSDLALKLEELIEDTDLSKKLSQNGRKLVEKSYNLNRYVKEIAVFLENIP